MKDCPVEMTVCFIFENVITRFVYQKVFMIDQGTHFLNDTIHALTQEFMIDYQNSTPYHSKANGIVEAFNKKLEDALTKVSNVQCDDEDQQIPRVLWVPRTTYK
jgi:transposase InsO family protein